MKIPHMHYINVNFFWKFSFRKGKVSCYWSRKPIEVAILSQSKPYPENQATRWTVYNHASIEPFMEDLDKYQLFQPNQPHVANDTVAQNGAENRANYDNDNIVYIMNNRKWIKERKCKLFEIDWQERRRGKNFMKRVKARWDTEYPASRRTAQNRLMTQKDSKRKNGEDQLN